MRESDSSLRMILVSIQQGVRDGITPNNSEFCFRRMQDRLLSERFDAY